jgi:hypothetical protein
MKKIVLCGDFSYPNGSASANYINSIATLFYNIGYKPIVISQKSIQFDKSSIPTFIDFFELPNLTGGLLRFVQLRFFFIKKIKKLINSIQFDNHDLILAYSLTPSILKTILSISKKRKLKTITFVVEWFNKSHYRLSYFSPHYFIFFISFFIYYPKFDYIFSVSNKIHNHFYKMNKNSFNLPYLHINNNRLTLLDKTFQGKYRIIVLGKDGEKNNITNLIYALSKFDLNTLNKFEFHFTNSNLKEINKSIWLKYNYILNTIFIRHNFLDNLLFQSLMNKCDFLYMIRPKTFSTTSNFPSKGPEALSLGKIPIASLVGDFENNYLSNNVDSIVVKDDSIDSIQEALQKLITLSQDDITKMSLNAYNNYINNFHVNTWEKSVKEFINDLDR